MRHDSHFVEQLFRAEEIPIGRKVAIHLIEANPDQPRSNLGDLASLRDSIQTHGVLEPLLVKRRDETRYTLISGERRFRAALEAGLAEVPCIELDLDPAEVVEIALVENLQRKDLTPFEEAEGFALLRERHSYTHEQIAKAVGRSRVTVTETLTLATLPDQVKDQCRRADIQSKSFLLELARLESETEMLTAIEIYLETGHFDRDALRAARKADPEAEDRTKALRKFPKQYELTYEPETHEGLKVSLVVRGESNDRATILKAVAALLERIGAGAIDLSKAGRFAKKPGAPKGGDAKDPGATAPENGDAPSGETDPSRIE
jgi:ParB family chromosome partitioning protein